MHKTSKLAELRAKTDRQLVALIDQQLDSALRLAEGFQNAPAIRNQRVPAKRSKAEKVLSDAAQLLPRVEALCERQRLEGKLGRLEGILSAESACASVA